MSNSSLNLTSLDFDTLKQEFKQYLQSQSVFKDYNYDGSNINVLLDVMAYNTFINAFYLNMVGSEMFLDTAQKLDSVVSHAKELNYLPRSKRASKAVVTFDIGMQGGVSPFIIPKGTLFSGRNSNNGFVFSTNSDRLFLSTNNYFIAEDLEIYEGSYVKETFVVDYSYENQHFILSNPDVDTTDIEIVVSENNGQSNSIYSYVDTLYGLKSNSEVYFLQATTNQRYEIVFGDNIFGKKPQNGAVIVAEYRVCSGSDSNSVETFNIDQDLGTFNSGISSYNVNFELNNVGLPGTYSEKERPKSSYGANAENIESIRYNAPKHYQTQGRCITDNDYKTTIIQKFPEVQYVNVYGGGVTNNSVEFGTVYISPSTYSGTVLTNSRKKDIETQINSLSAVGIKCKIVDPDYLFVKLDSKVHVDFNNTKSSTSLIISKITAAVKNYNINALQNFNTALRTSKLEQKINESDVGIISNETSSYIFKIFDVPLNIPYAIYCDLNNPIIKGTVISESFVSMGSNFVFTDFIDGVDLGTGKIYILEKKLSTSKQNYTEIGTVNYVDGSIKIGQIEYFNTNGGIRIYAQPKNQDIYCMNNNIIEIDTINGLTFNVVSN
jgi:hypothetical protein